MSARTLQSRVLYTASSRHVFWSMAILYFCSEIHGARIPTRETFVLQDICTSSECVSAARTIYDNQNVSVKPCENFYEFVCGGWSSSHPLASEDGLTRSQSWDLNHLNTARVRDILATRSRNDEPEYLSKAKTFYNSCLKRDEQAERNFKILNERLDTWGGWPIASERWNEEKFDWKKLLIYLLKTNDLYPLMRIYVSLDYRNTTQATIMIDQANDRFCPFHESAKGEEILEKAIIKTAQQIANATFEDVSVEAIEEDAAEIVRLEGQICKMRRKEKNRTDRTRFSVKTVRQLQSLSDDTEPVNEFAQIKWINVLNDYLQGATVQIDEKEEIIIVEPDFISEILELIDEVPQRTLANYMLWYHIEWMGADEWLEFVDIDELLSSSENAKSSPASERRWKTCTEETNAYFQHAVGYQYVQIYFDEESKKGAEGFVKRILSSLVEDLQRNDWMDPRTRTLAVEKAKHMKLLVGYPDWYNTSTLNELYMQYFVGDNYIINAENFKRIEHRELLGLFDGTGIEIDYWSPVTDVNAYHIEPNMIVLPAGIFQAPFYVKGRPEALNYGSMGYIIGHELSHSFDTTGRKYDKHGSLNNWWSTEALKKYAAKKQCIEDLFNKFPTPELEDEKAWRLDGLKTVGENMADIGGMEIALSTYKKYLRLHGPDKKLPGLTQYSSEQLFFIGYVTANCETSTSEYLSAVILEDEHTPNKYSAMITVANSNDFLEAWNCTEENKIKSSNKKCRFW